MKDQLLELLSLLEGEINSLTLEQTETAVELFDHNLSPDFVARLLKGDEDWAEWQAWLSRS